MPPQCSIALPVRDNVTHTQQLKLLQPGTQPSCQLFHSHQCGVGGGRLSHVLWKLEHVIIKQQIMLIVCTWACGSRHPVDEATPGRQIVFLSGINQQPYMGTVFFFLFFFFKHMNLHAYFLHYLVFLLCKAAHWTRQYQDVWFE